MLTASMFAQESAPAPSAASAPSPFTVDCATVEAGASCRSYNELIKSGDKDILRDVSGSFDAYVCFLTDEDTFVVIDTSPPFDILFKKSAISPRLTEQNSASFLSRYKNGIIDDGLMAQGKWIKNSVTSEAPIFRSPSANDPGATVDDSEVTFHYSYKNTHGRKVNYDISIRRSTKRFSETSDIPISQDKKEEPSRYTNTGHCAEFPASR
jgi:hypothetical protein